MTIDQKYKEFCDTDRDTFAAKTQGWTIGMRRSFTAGYKAGIADAAAECNRMMMYPGGRQESFAHDGVDAAAAAIRTLGDAK